MAHLTHAALNCSKISRVNGSLNPDARKSKAGEQPGQKPAKPIPLTARHNRLRSVWLSDTDGTEYKELKEVCAAAEKAGLTWNQTASADILPAAWVRT